MRCILWLGLAALAGMNGFAQRGGYGPGTHGGNMHGRSAPAGVPPFRGGRGVRRLNPGFGFPFGGGFYPVFDGDYDVEQPPAYAYPPSTVVVEPVQPVIVQQESPRAPTAVIRTYNVDTPAPGKPPTFVIATTGGSRLEGAAVWVQDGFLHYIDPNDEAHQLPLSAVDRPLTRKLNEDRGLTLRLPAP